MTAKRDLKKRIRERVDHTGERYTTARAHVLRAAGAPGEAEASPGRPPQGISVVEMTDLTERAAGLGIRCQVLVYPDLAARVDHDALLANVLRAVLATSDDPDTESFRALVLRGERLDVPGSVLSAALTTAIRQFMARAQAGIGGLSPDKLVLAFHMVGREGLEAVLCTHLYASHVQTPGYLQRKPALILTPPSPLVLETHQLLGFLL